MDLADSTKGDKMVAHSDNVAPAYLQTVSDILNAGRVSVMRFIPREKHAALYAGTSVEDFTANLNEAINSMINGGELTLPPVTFNTMGLQLANARDLKITGAGWKSTIKNNSNTGAPGLWVRGDTIEDRTYGLDMSSLTFEGNPLSGNGLTLDRLGWYDLGTRQASVTNLDKVRILNAGNNGVQGTAIDAPETQEQIDRHYRWICLSWTPDRESYRGLGDLYVDSDEFRVNFEVDGGGNMAEWTRDAMAHYAETRL